MRNLVAITLIIATVSAAAAGAQTSYRAPRTALGQPDLQGAWTNESFTRLERRPSEKIVWKRYASAFKGTNFHDMLTMSRVDTLIVVGVSTSHCVYATCRDATDSFHVIVPREGVGERCELAHEVFLHDIDVDLGDVMPMADVLGYLAKVKNGTLVE